MHLNYGSTVFSCPTRISNLTCPNWTPNLTSICLHLTPLPFLPTLRDGARAGLVASARNLRANPDSSFSSTPKSSSVLISTDSRAPNALIQALALFYSMIASHQIGFPDFISFYHQFPIMYPGLLSFTNAKAIRFLLAQEDPPVVNHHPEQQKPLLQIILMLILASLFFNNGITHQQRRAGSPAGQWEHRCMESGPARGNEAHSQSSVCASSHHPCYHLQLPRPKVEEKMEHSFHTAKPFNRQ